MLSTRRLTLQQLGWKPFFAQQRKRYPNFLPARVSRQDLNRYHLLTEMGSVLGLLPSKTRAEINSRAELPTVGDWVLIAPDISAGQTRIQKTLERATKLSRRQAGHGFGEQVIAANIDTVFIVSGLDHNFNLNRIERYLLLCYNSGAVPVIVLNKTDLCEDLDAKIALTQKIAMGTPVYPVSAINKHGIKPLKTHVREGETAALLGSSGVGKSTITNLLIGLDYLATGKVRKDGSRGRHTTTHRELCPIQDGGLIIDTPGMREIQLWVDESTASAGFDDIQGAAKFCRFNDCQHRTEPDCGVQAAINRGELSEARWQHYQKFQQELNHLAAQQGLQLKTKQKEFTKIARKLSKKITFRQ